MTPKRFPSKIDAWILILLVLALVVQTIAMVFVSINRVDAVATTIMVVTTVLLWAFIGSMLRFTHYTVDGPMLIVRSGPFRWKIPIDAIHSVEATRNPLSSPALSLDRLKITWGEKRRIMISPADKKGFLKALGMELTNG